MELREKDTALLDLLAGWTEFIADSQAEAEQPFEEFKEGFEHTDEDHYRSFRAHYTADYTDGVHELYRLASEKVLGDEDGSPEMTPAEFIRRHILPFFEGSE